jgi:hypothetical protein
MSVKKIIILAVAAIFLATPALADNVPEFEAVCCDATNIFAADAELTYGVVTENNIVFGVPINKASDFCNGVDEYYRYDGAFGLTPDFCRPGYFSNITLPQSAGTYHWRFTLQQTPESDINVNIYDCVLKPQGTDIFTEAQQTGRVNDLGGKTKFFRSQNPRMTVQANTLRGSFLMTARKMPNLGRTCMDNRLYTSKAHWEEGIVLELPREGRSSRCPGTQYQLQAGDTIDVTVQVDIPHPALISYGQDSVLLKYIGIKIPAVITGDFANPVFCANDD